MMGYDKRFDGRAFDELRPIEAKAGVIPRAHGSAYFKIGNTIAYAAVYGPRELHPKFMQNPKTGILRCNYNMMPFSGMGDRVRPGANRRAKEISMVTEKALAPVLDLKDYPNAVVDVFIELPQTDAGSRCAGICAASIALADAGIPMKDMVCAVSVGVVGDKVLTDLDYKEEAYEDGPVADIPVAMIPSTEEISLLQMDGEISKERLAEALELARKVCGRIYEKQKAALKEKYGGEVAADE
jgi:exosome complex component RRP41